MGHTTRFLQALSILGGLGLIGVSAWLNAHEIQKIEGTYLSPVVAMVVALAVASAIAALAVTTAWRQRRKALAIVMLVGVIAGESYAFYLTAERVLAGRETRAGSAVTANYAIGRAHERMMAAETALAKAREGVAAALADRACNHACREAALTAEGLANERLADAEAVLKSTGVIRTESQIAQAIGARRDLVDLVPALSAPLALLVLGFTLLAFGYHAEPSFAEAEAVPVSDEPPPGTRADQAQAWIRAYMRKHGRPPRFHEVRNELALPKVTAHRYLKKAVG